ncbi:MAG: hypothetical protein AAGK23_02835 [Pseudomonadota bacterium]
MTSKINSFLSDLQIPRILELREFDESFEIDTEAVDFSYNGAEGYWFDKSMDWIVYCSHEQTVTMGGIIAALLNDFPEIS